MEEGFDFTTALTYDIVGQKRIGKYKQFVFIHNNYAIKGPYQQGNLNNVISRSQIFTAWTTPCVVRAIDYLMTKDGTFVRFPNVMAGYKLESELYHETFSGLQYNVLKTPPVIDIGHAFLTNPWIPNEVEDLLLALCHCNILGVGDMNMRNILVDPIKHTFYIIDFDDNLGKDRDDQEFYFNKASAKKYRWYEKVAHHYNKVADRLIPLLTDPIVTTNNLISRVERAINLLRRFGTTEIKGLTTGITFIGDVKQILTELAGGTLQQHEINRLAAAITTRTPKQPAILQIPGPATQIPIQTNVICVKVKDIRPKYKDLKQWAEDPNNVYIGRRGVVFITDETGTKVRYPSHDSIWANPFKIEGITTRETSIQQYRNYILNKLQNGEISIDELEKLRGKTLGCWCKEGGQDIPCHGDVLVELLELNKQGLLKVPIKERITAGPIPTQLPPVKRVPIPTQIPPIKNVPIPTQIPPVEKIPILTPTRLTLQIQQPTRKIGQMVWKGLRGGATKTYSGLDFDIAKSALQKYIRRNMPQKAILAAIELYRLGEVGGDLGVNNMYNRLAIIANEDIGPANLPLVLEVTKIVESGDRHVARLATMVQLMAESSKTRMISHAWRAYANPEGRAIAMKIGLPVDTAFTESDIIYINENKNSDLFLTSDPENIRPYILIFLKRLYEKDFNAYSWVYFFLETAKDTTLTKRRKFIHGNPRSTTGKADILIWKALSKILPPETHDILVEAYYNHTENRPFLQNAILIALYELPYKKFNIEPAVEIWRQQPVLQQMLNGDFTFEVDPYVIDKHTRKGRTMGKTIKEFVEEGSVVIPQSKEYYSKTLETIYKTR